MKKEVNKKNWDKILEEWQGKGTIQAIRVEVLDTGEYRLVYKDGKKQEFIDWATRRELDEALIAFGGKNPQTVATPAEFLKINSWRSNDLVEMGHHIKKIKLIGTRSIRNSKIPISFPEGCGNSELPNSKKVKTKTGVNFNKHFIDEERCDLTVHFDSNDEFDNFVENLLGNEYLAELSWVVIDMVTFSYDEKKMCLWHRGLAGDGSKRMELSLLKLDGKHYNHCIYYDLIAAADGLVGSECKKVPCKKQEPKERLICFTAATEGRVG